MTRRVAVVIMVLVLAAAGCSNLGLGQADCTPPERDFSSANLLNAQAVPTAKYTPCLNELRMGWDSVDLSAEDGRAGIEILRGLDPFLTATVTASCDVSGATPVPSGYPDIERYEAVEFEPVDIEITIVPRGERPLLAARLLADKLAEEELDGRPVTFTVDQGAHLAVSPRVVTALAADQYVWIIDELDAEEGTVELRSNDPAVAARGVMPGAALDLIEEQLPELFYRGHWYFTFEGGCITYEFDAKRNLAETVAADADDALGFYPAFQLRQLQAGETPLGEYVETLDALVTEMVRKLDAAQARFDETPTLETARVTLAQNFDAVSEFHAGATAVDPPVEVAELHAGMVEFMGELAATVEAFATRAQTSAGLEELLSSAEAWAYEAMAEEMSSLCRQFRTSIEASTADEGFADVPWIPGELLEAVDVAFRCS